MSENIRMINAIADSKFDICIKYFELYINSQNYNENFSAYQADKALKRLRQLKIIYSKILILEESYLFYFIERLKKDVLPIIDTDIKNNSLTNLGNFYLETQEKTDELQMYVESFYYFAWRARNSIFVLEGLKKFDPIGVRRVRGLIEHPEHVKFYQQSFAFGGPNGPVLKNARDNGFTHIYQDKGLYSNATEFIEKLETCLKTKIRKINLEQTKFSFASTHHVRLSHQ